MEAVENIEVLYAAYSIGAVSESDVVEWAIDHYNGSNNNPVNSSLLDIASLLTNTPETQKAGDLLENIILTHFPDFESRRESLTIEVLIYHCQKLLGRKITPYQFCKVVDPIERIFDFPNWLGNLFNTCDWVEPNTEPDSQFLDAIQAELQELKRLLDEKRKYSKP